MHGLGQLLTYIQSQSRSRAGTSLRPVEGLEDMGGIQLQCGIDVILYTEGDRGRIRFIHRDLQPALCIFPCL